MNDIIIEDVSLNVSDGTSMAAFVARPKDSDKHPGIFIFQEAYGVNSHIRDVTKRFAREGFIAIAPELFHRTAHGFEGDYNDFNSTRVHTQALTNEGLLADINAINDWMHNNTKLLYDEIASVGFCMGGRVSFLANTTVKLKAAVSFYGGGITTILNRVPKIQAPQLMFWGGLDKHIDEAQINAVTSTLKSNNKVYTNVIVSNAEHAFFCDARSNFNPIAAKQAWALTLEFLYSYINKN